MKKLLYTALLTIALGALDLMSQSNGLTWTIHNKMEKGFFKTVKQFDATFSGFKSKEEAMKFTEQFKTAPEVASYTVGTVTDSKCDVKFTMANTQDKMFYLGMASKLGIEYISGMGQTKTVTEMLNKQN